MNANTAILLVIAVVLLFLQAVRLTQSDSILAYRAGAIYLAFAAAQGPGRDTVSTWTMEETGLNWGVEI